MVIGLRSGSLMNGATTRNRGLRSYGKENREFNGDELMQRNIANINDAPIEEGDRKFHWPLGRRLNGHPSLSNLVF